MLVIGAVLVLAAVFCGYLAVVGMPETRGTRGRVAEYSVVERKPLFRRMNDTAVSTVEGVLSRRGWRPFTSDELELAGMRTSVAALVVLVIALGGATFSGLVALQLPALLAFVVSLLVPGAAKVVVRAKVTRRRKRFAGQLGSLLQMMASSLRAGQSLPSAMDSASRDADSPMAEELTRVVNEYRIGRDLVDAMEQVAERMQSEDFRWIAQAIEAQRATGGNLNEILDQVAETIRERQHIREQVSALSAEGRISAYILMALPVGIGVYYSMVAPDRMGLFIDSGIGKLILLGCGVMYVLGGFWMRSIVRIEF
ncbi:type II secretion system F family protein [Aeromicrobium sp. 50.2.37]|uniref:type II secretion system F family protein n=1 Tax=Aeromicrobium sp. 50.2.37 TaxID=2969305 RepID=UPI00214FD6AF|nr:type II secretion system F family protein [Aeromicrobium sp. 50.2.37]MCR4514970.1 type II secretion system F family protein [Aeromicrobium sp. 50.2.37]